MRSPTRIVRASPFAFTIYAKHVYLACLSPKRSWWDKNKQEVVNDKFYPIPSGLEILVWVESNMTRQRRKRNFKLTIIYIYRNYHTNTQHTVFVNTMVEWWFHPIWSTMSFDMISNKTNYHFISLNLISLFGKEIEGVFGTINCLPKV